MVTKDGPESQMGGVGYAQLEGHWALLTAYSGVIQLCQQGIDKKVVEVAVFTSCLAVSPLSDVMVVGESNFVKVSQSLCRYSLWFSWPGLAQNSC